MFVHGTALKITVQDLRFDADEAQSYLGDNFPRDQVADMLYLAEGWPAGLRQTREIALRRPEQARSKAALLDALSRDEALATYFSNALQQQPEPVRSFVTRVSVLEEMTAEMADCLLQSAPDSGNVCNPVARESVYCRYRRPASLVSIPPAIRRLAPAPLHRAGSRRHLQQGDRLAVPQGILPPGAALSGSGGTCGFHCPLLISSGGLSLMFRGGPAVTRFLQTLPLAVVQANPALELARIYRLVQSGELMLARRDFESLKERTAGFAVAGDVFAPTAADGVVMELLLSLYEDRILGPQTLINAEASLGIDQSGNAIRPSVIRELLAWSFYHAGNFSRARTIGRESVDLCLRAGIPYVEIYAYLAIGLAELAEGHVSEAAGIYALAETEAARHFGAECNQVMAAQILGAEILYARNQVETARDITAYWCEAVAHGDGWVDLHASLYRTLASALRALDDSPAALAILDQARQMARQRKLWRLEQILENHQLREACLAGELSLADQLAKRLTSEHPRSISLHHQGWRVWFTRLLALARYALEKRDLTACALALQDIDRQARIGAGNHSMFRLERDLLEARMLFARGDEAYTRPLTRSLAHAAKARLLRPILDEGPPIRPILRHYAASGSAPPETLDYLQQLLTVLDKPAARSTSAAAATITAEGGDVGLEISSGEPLSKREAEVLALICEGLTSKEIGRRLSISVNTVLTYRKSLYRKLCATTRSQLIAIARDQRILRPVAAPS